ncbi:DUF3558 domain-containing protein [Actinomadura harenae]|uniref:hypothetical protein n=1 Tax=Actinomadura harenae TaxID=2483351 RepID=UPI0011C49615|nr:hypothetical protein [Actinomadura harenae]
MATLALALTTGCLLVGCNDTQSSRSGPESPAPVSSPTTTSGTPEPSKILAACDVIDTTAIPELKESNLTAKTTEDTADRTSCRWTPRTNDATVFSLQLTVQKYPTPAANDILSSKEKGRGCATLKRSLPMKNCVYGNLGSIDVGHSDTIVTATWRFHRPDLTYSKQIGFAGRIGEQISSHLQ